MWTFAGRQVVFEISTSGRHTFTIKANHHQLSIGGNQSEGCIKISQSPLYITISTDDHDQFCQEAREFLQASGIKQEIPIGLFSTQAVYYDGCCWISVNLDRSAFAAMEKSVTTYCISGGTKSYKGSIDYFGVLEPFVQEGTNAVDRFASGAMVSFSNAQVSLTFQFEVSADRILQR